MASQPDMKSGELFSLAVRSKRCQRCHHLKVRQRPWGGTGKTGLNEILSRGRKGTLDWDTQRMSPRTLRSQLKLYQPVENSVNENRTATSDPRAIPSFRRDCSHRQAYIRVFPPLAFDRSGRLECIPSQRSSPGVCGWPGTADNAVKRFSCRCIVGHAGRAVFPQGKRHGLPPRTS